jgi:hypothetical protein
VVEEIGAYYWRRDGISSVALRLPAVWRAEHHESALFRQSRERLTAFLDQFASQAEDERAQQIAEVRKRALDFRQRRLLETPAAQATLPSDDLLWKLYTFDRFNFWAWVDERDAAQAVEKSLTSDYEGDHILFVVNDQNYLGYDSQTLSRLFFPEVSEWKRPLQGSESLISSERAARLIGYESEHSIQPIGGD